MTQPEAIIKRALSTETYFTTLPSEARIELLAVLVVDRIQTDLDAGQALLKKLKKELT